MEGIVAGKQPGSQGFNLPGFRFHPTDEELLDFYLKKKAHGHNFCYEVIGTLDLYQYDPWQVPALANHMGEREWFFFVPRDRKRMPSRRSRLTASGYWKATGSDRVVRSQGLLCIGFKKTLVFYIGKAPHGNKTDWIMNEYRLPDCSPSLKKDVVLCRIYRKATSLKTLEQRAAMVHNHHIQQEKGGDGEESLDSGKHKFHSTSDLDGCPSYHRMANTQSSSLNSNNDCKLREYHSLIDDGFSSVDKRDGECQMEFVITPLEDCKLKPSELEVPKFDVDSLFRQDIASPWTPFTMFSASNE